MKKLNLSKISNNVTKMFNDFTKKLNKHAPELWAGAGLGILISSGVGAVAVTPKATRIIDKASEEKELTFKEKASLVGKYYIAPVSGAILGSGCVIKSVTTSNQRYLVLSSAYQFINESFSTYKEKVIETVGEKKEEIIKSKVAEDRLKKNSIESNQIIVTGRGKNLCYDSYSGRYFEFDISKIGEIENNINYQIVHFNYISLNEMYSFFGLEPIDCGYELGWNIDSVPNKALFAFDKSSKLASDGQPCLVINYNVAPSSKYDMFA